MTITRIAQFSAESQILTDFAIFSESNVVRPAISSAQAKTGTYSYLFIGSRGPIGVRLITPITTARMGFWMYMGNTTINNTFSVLCRIGSGLIESQTSPYIKLLFEPSSGQLYLARPIINSNTTENLEKLATIPIPTVFTSIGTWFHVGITHHIDATVGYFSLYIDGVRLLQYIGDTRPSYWSGSTQAFEASSLGFFAVGAENVLAGFTQAWQDDIFFDNMQGELDMPVPSRRFSYVLTTGVGANAAWTPVPVVANYLNVDDNPHDGDATYNKALVASLRDTFAVGDIVLPVDHQIVAAIPSPFVKRLDSELQHKLSVHAYDGVTYADSPDLDLSMSYDVAPFHRFLLQPDGTPWNEADFNAMQFGYQSRGTF